MSNDFFGPPGHRDERVALLPTGRDIAKHQGCTFYLVGCATDDDATVRVSEVWESQQAHGTAQQSANAHEVFAQLPPLPHAELVSHERRIIFGPAQ